MQKQKWVTSQSDWDLYESSSQSLAVEWQRPPPPPPKKICSVSNIDNKNNTLFLLLSGERNKLCKSFVVAFGQPIPTPSP